MKGIQKTNADFRTELRQLGNKNVRVTGKYQSSFIPVECVCKKCKHKWKAIPSNLLRGSGCNKCSISAKAEKIRKTHEKFVEELNSNIETVDKYCNAKSHMTFKCKNCLHKWMARPSSLLNNVIGCPKCAGNMLKTHKQFVSEMNAKNNSVEVIGKYIKALIPIECRCRKCKHYWKAAPNDLLKGTACPKCRSSKGERMISSFLEELSVEPFEYQIKFDTCKGRRCRMPFDFGNKNKKVLLEFDGVFHFKISTIVGKNKKKMKFKLEETKWRDNIKNKWAKNNGYYLYRIPYTMEQEQVRKEVIKILKKHKILKKAT